MKSTPIKAYQTVDRKDETVSFSISRMEEIYKKTKGVADEPHRHHFFTTLLIKAADGKHIIDFNEYQLSNQQLYFIAPEQVHQLIENQASIGYAIIFSTDFLIQNNIPLSFIEDVNLFHQFGESPPIQLQKAQMEQLTFYAEELIRLRESNIQLKTQAIGAYLKLFLIQANNYCILTPDNLHEQEVVHTTLRKFKKLLEENHQNWHFGQQYAEAMNLSADHLNRLIKSMTGKSLKEMIQARITTTAKRMLYFSSLSNKEIGYQLGFSEPANFSAFFKKCTGLSPSAFRKQR